MVNIAKKQFLGQRELIFDPTSPSLKNWHPSCEIPNDVPGLPG